MPEACGWERVAIQTPLAAAAATQHLLLCCCRHFLLPPPLLTSCAAWRGGRLPQGVRPLVAGCPLLPATAACRPAHPALARGAAVPVLTVLYRCRPAQGRKQGGEEGGESVNSHTRSFCTMHRACTPPPPLLPWAAPPPNLPAGRRLQPCPARPPACGAAAGAPPPAAPRRGSKG